MANNRRILLTLIKQIKMVFTITTIVSLIIALLAWILKEEFILTFLFFPLIFGYGLMGTEHPVKKETVIVNQVPVCSEEFGECRVYIEKVDKEFMFDLYKEYSLLSESKDCVKFKLTIGYNSYGGEVSSELEINY